MVDSMKVFFFDKPARFPNRRSLFLHPRPWFLGTGLHSLNRQAGFPDLSIQTLPSLHLLMC